MLLATEELDLGLELLQDLTPSWVLLQLVEVVRDAFGYLVCLHDGVIHLVLDGVDLLV